MCHSRASGSCAVDDGHALEIFEGVPDRLVLVLVSRPDQLLKEGRVREWLAGPEDVELDLLGTGLGEGGAPRGDLGPSSRRTRHLNWAFWPVGVTRRGTIVDRRDATGGPRRDSRARRRVESAREMPLAWVAADGRAGDPSRQRTAPRFGHQRVGRALKHVDRDSHVFGGRSPMARPGRGIRRRRPWNCGRPRPEGSEAIGHAPSPHGTHPLAAPSRRRAGAGSARAGPGTA